jgi:hypothetical protein
MWAPSAPHVTPVPVPTSGAASASVSGARPHRNPGGAVALAVELYGISFSSLSFFATAAVIDRHPRVRGLLWGHVHQRYDDHAGGLRLMGTPSTCYQFVPGRDDFALDGLGPGYRRIQLRADGRIDSQVMQLEP